MWQLTMLQDSELAQASGVSSSRGTWEEKVQLANCETQGKKWRKQELGATGNTLQVNFDKEGERW